MLYILFYNLLLNLGMPLWIPLISTFNSSTLQAGICIIYVNQPFLPSVLGMEPRGSYTLDKSSTTEPS
jgi:hypothetical protein